MGCVCVFHARVNHSYTVEDFMRDQDVEYFDPEVQAALAKLDAKSARSLNVATPHWAPTLARRLQMQRLRAIKEVRHSLRECAVLRRPLHGCEGC